MLKSVGLFSFLIMVLYFSGVLFPSNAHAYLDPGTGAFILQLVGGVIFAVMVTFRLWWYKLIGLFSSKPKVDDTDEE